MKLSNIEKILLSAIVEIVLFEGLAGKDTSPDVNKPTQIQPVPKVESLGLTVNEFSRAYEELVERYSVPSARIRETYTKGKSETYFYLNDSVLIALETEDANCKILKNLTLSSKIRHLSISKGDITYKSMIYDDILMLSAEPN